MTRSSTTEWRFLNTEFGDAFFNMAVDEQLVRSVDAGLSPPTVRVFGWRPPAISFGYAQKIAREVDLVEAEKRGIDIVRRPTGGRAVLHWNELTYSVILPADHPSMGGNIAGVYRAISMCLVTGLVHLGVDATLEPGKAPVPSPRGKDVTSPCFSSTSQYEITLRGRKLVGSAQRRMGDVVLQHGSLLIGPEHKQVTELMPSGREHLQQAYADQLDAHTISLSESGSPLLFDDVAVGIRHGFARGLGCDPVDIPLSDEERAGIDQLTTDKYGTPEWNHLDRSADVAKRLIV